jgi:alkanesulfonate monooxygenase SsuD/methylene tetrahydromethanopterin reductase-like flavin-dependent oxidoreductase (luciferase family)
MDLAGVDAAIKAGALLCGNPEEVAEQIKAYEATGVDQVVFGLPNHLSKYEATECLELFGKHVIPEFDKDPKHSTTRYRESVKPA